MSRRFERGQSTVEFALVLPVLTVVVLLVAQVGLVIWSQIAVTHAAREVARALAVDPGLDPVEIAASSGLVPGDALEITVGIEAHPSGYDRVRVVVAIEVPSVIGIVPGAPESLRVEARATMLREGGGTARDPLTRGRGALDHAA